MAEPVTAATTFLAATSSAVAPAVRTTLDNLAKSFAKPVANFTRSIIDRAIVDLRIGFEDYLNTSYNRCRFYKTILNPNLPVEVTKNYVNLYLTYGKMTLEDIEVIKNLEKYMRIVVTGLAGSGKSMFMKYLTINRFEGVGDRVPLFVELRRLNQLTDRNLLTFIRASCTSRRSKVTQQQFEISLQVGAFVLILDGFDELNYEYRDEVQRQIIDLTTDFPSTTVIVSSRPDDRFGGWSSFHVLNMNELTKKQTMKLIDGLDYDSGVKTRFSRVVTDRLYDSHTSFLSSPLLTTIMLLTYEQFADIPDKMHVFYSQAFDTLFQKHDAQKEQYQRKTFAGLSKDDFRSCLSAFSAMLKLDTNIPEAIE
jgi:NACHT domain